jgi:hypothetical protein
VQWLDVILLSLLLSALHVTSTSDFLCSMGAARNAIKNKFYRLGYNNTLQLTTYNIAIFVKLIVAKETLHPLWNSRDSLSQDQYYQNYLTK